MEEQRLSTDFDLLFKYSTIDWKELVENEKLSENFLEQHFDDIGPDNIVLHQNLSIEFIDKFKDSLDMLLVVECQELTEEFIIDNIAVLQIPAVIHYQKLSEKFIREHFDDLNFGDNFLSFITKYQKLTVDFFDKQILSNIVGKKYGDVICNAVMYQDFPTSYFITNFDTFNSGFLIYSKDWFERRHGVSKRFIRTLVQYKKLNSRDVQFIYKIIQDEEPDFKNDIYEEFLQYQQLDSSILISFIVSGVINEHLMCVLIKYQKLHEDFIKSYIDIPRYLSQLVAYQNLSDEFLINHKLQISENVKNLLEVDSETY